MARNTSVSALTRQENYNMENAKDNRPDALELGENEVKASHPLSPENFPHSYYSERSKKWVVRNTIQNLDYFLKYHRIKTRLNEMTYRVEVEMNGCTEYSAKNIDHFVIIKSLLAESGLDKILNVNDYATQIAIKNMYSPVRDWVTSKPLSSAGNIQKIVKALDTENPKLTEILLTKWLVSGIKAWFHKDGISAQGVLVLCGKQGGRKTSFLKNLLPREMRLEGHVLNVGKDGNKITALSWAMVELGEIMASIRVSGNDPLKGFFTTEEDSIRVPYGKVDTVRPRRTIFCGSVNNARFLTDETGNRRYWVVNVTKSSEHIDTDHGVDPQQLWAEAKNLYDNGHPWYLTQEEEKMLEESNKNHEIENTMQELLLSKYDWKEPRTRWLSCAEIMQDIDVKVENEGARKNITKALNKMKSEQPFILSKRAKRGTVYELPRIIKNIAYCQSQP